MIPRRDAEYDCSRTDIHMVYGIDNNYMNKRQSQTNAIVSSNNVKRNEVKDSAPIYCLEVSILHGCQTLHIFLTQL